MIICHFTCPVLFWDCNIWVFLRNYDSLPFYLYVIRALKKVAKKKRRKRKWTKKMRRRSPTEVIDFKLKLHENKCFYLICGLTTKHNKNNKWNRFYVRIHTSFGWQLNHKKKTRARMKPNMNHRFWIIDKVRPHVR